MKDQAAALRLTRNPSHHRDDGDGPIVFGSGKGGVGKSLAAISAAVAAASVGRKTLLVDGDQNLGNLHVLLGVRPALTPEAVWNNEAVAGDLPISIAANLWLLPADSGAEALHGLSATDRARLQHRLGAIHREYDVVIVDAGAGLESALRCASLRASRLVVVTMPEPTALTDAYALVKIVHRELPSLPIDVLVNRTLRDNDGVAAYERLSTAAERFLERGLGMLGSVPDDADLRQRLSDPRALLAALPQGPALAALRDLFFRCAWIVPARVEAAS